MGSPDVEKPDGLTAAVKIPQLSPDPLTGPIPTAAAPLRPVAAADDEVMEMPTWKKWVTLAVVCWMALPVTFSGSSILTATSEVAADFNVSTHAITTANAGVFIAMAMSALIWLPTSNILGRRTTYLVANCLLTLCSIGSALSNSFACFTAIWVIGGTTGPFFLVAGQTILADIFEPSLSTDELSAPLTGAVIVTFTSWRVIYGVQAGMTFLGLIMAFFFVPKASQLAHLKIAVAERTPIRSLGDLGHAFNPMGVLRQFKYPNIVAANFACGLLGFNQYGLLSSIRRVINPRFGLTTPLISGLFYLAPGAGFLMGSTIGGRVSDHTVKRYIRKRNGLRLPQDRLKSSLPAIFFVLPAGTLIYGWSVQKEVGGIALPIVSCFFEGLGLMWSFSGLNTYSAEAMPERRTAVISSKYIVQYSFGAGSVGGLVPMIDAIGVGWSFTIKFSVSLKRHQDDSHIRFKNLQTRSPPTAMEVLQLTEEINRDGAHRHRSWRPNATRLVTVLERICQFAPIGDVLVGGAQNLLASGVWATVRMTLETQAYMCEYVIVFIKICKKITIDAHKSFASHLATSFTSTFDSVFKPLEDDLRSWGQLIENRVAVLVAKANVESNLSSIERFSRFQVMISRDAAHRDRETRAHRLFEALAPNQKEFESIWTRERKKGTSSWILNDKSYQEWLDTKTSATLWLQVWQCVLVLDGLDEDPLEEVESVLDLESYISAEVENWKLIRPISSRLEQLVKEQLLVRSQGMFLWLSLQIEAICPKYTRELRSESEILDIINNLPRNLPQAFDQAILRIPDMKYGSRVFQLIASADPCLSLDELRVALNVQPGSSIWSSSTLHPSGFTLASTYGGSLLEIDEEDSCIRFIHHSVLLHLVQAPALPAASPYHFHLHQAEFELGAICVTYLNYGVFENSMSHAQNVSFDKIPGELELPTSDAVVVKEVLRITLTVIKQYKVDLETSTAEAYPIISRLNELHHHYLRHEFFLSGEDAGLLVPTYLLHMGLDVPVLNSLVEMECLPFGTGDKYCQFKDPVAVEMALGTIARHGIPRVLLFLQQESQEEAERDRCIKSALLLAHYLPSIDTTLSNGSTILHTAIKYGFEDLAETLLKDRGADPDGARLQGISSPLQLCLQKKFRHLAVILTQMGADIIATPDNGLPPFFLAMGLRDLRLFDAMWHGNPHRSSRQYGPKKETAFQFACRVYCDPISKDYPDISDALDNILAKDPDVNRPNGDGETPLMITAMTGNLELMVRLLDQGADPTLAGVNGATPLHLAVEDTVAKLLEVGVDPNKVTPDGVSPLMVASLLGDIAAVKTLLHGGALRFQAVAGAGPLSEGGKALFRMSKRYPRFYDAESSTRNATIDKIEAGDTALSLAIARLEFMTGDKEQISRLRQIVKDTVNKDAQNKVRAKVTHITERWDDFETIVLELLSRNRDPLSG
ncbi:major facilitator superfamily transporter [Colletotrichum lupini]|uniref:Major facilitator superfamily transporter n=1 Tax=Colletotrichum lupini TaxID=145971 RepID=A0A9Q8SAS0_9PEZI|nr:major facilitator superfamily transporter [Colletotrichum lupini]UQC73496.1 major facilitator superfamily transporter [Colletotrichum lupini]